MMKLVQPMIFSLLLCVLLPLPAYAQTTAGNPAPAGAPIQAPAAVDTAPAALAAQATAAVKAAAKTDLDSPFSGSFFLSTLEIAAIQKALAGKVAPADTLNLDNPGIALAAHRVIRISGVVYRAPGDWVVWMNGQKVTPGNLLPQILDISVRDSSNVSLKWYDAGLKKVISITLRPQQVYDITTGILLPGSE